MTDTLHGISRSPGTKGELLQLEEVSLADTLAPRCNKNLVALETLRGKWPTTTPSDLHIFIW